MKTNTSLIKLPFFLLACLVLAACSSPAENNLPPSPTLPEGLLTPYVTITPTPSITPTLPGAPTATPTVTLTPTPRIHTVKGNDTMLGLAWYYGVSLEALKTANPDVNPRAMSNGLKLIIPPSTTKKATETPSPAQPTALPLNAGAVTCHPDPLGGSWCFLLVSNEQSVAVENVSASIQWVDKGGSVKFNQTAFSVLGLLRSGESMPLMAYFDTATFQGLEARIAIESALPVDVEDQRYTPVEIQEPDIRYSSNHTAAVVKGFVALTTPKDRASTVRVAAVAYDAAGQVVSIRVWNSAETLTTGTERPFTLAIYSLHGTIDHIELLVEAEK